MWCYHCKYNKLALACILLFFLSFVRENESQDLKRGRFDCKNLQKKGRNAWIVDEAAVRSVNRDVQILVDCMPDGGSMLLDIEQLELENTLKLTRAVKIEAGEKVRSRSPKHTGRTEDIRILCPKGKSAFEIRSKGVTLSNMVFRGCKTNGSAVVDILSGSDAVIKNTQFASNSNAGGSGCISAHGATVSVKDCLFVSNDGGAIAAQNSSTVEIYNTKFEGNTGRKGGAVKAVESSVLVKASSFKANKAEERGGAIYFKARHGRAQLNLQKVDFLNNTLSGKPQEDDLASKSGGAIAVVGTGSTCRIAGSDFEGNSAFGHGGGVLVEDAHALVFKNSSFVGNVAYQGGAIHVKTDSEIDTNTTVKIIAVEFITNKAESGYRAVNHIGGAVVVDNVESFELKNSSFIGNSATLAGGGLSVQSVAIASVTNCIFARNTADYGGGMEIYELRLDMQDTLFVNNRVLSSGGAIFADDGKTGTYVDLQRANFQRNSANTGGAVAILSGSTIQHSWSVVECMFESNVALDDRMGGGGMFLTGSRSFYSINGTVFRNNVAPRGGGIQAAVILPGGVRDPVEFIIQDTLFEGNNAKRQCAGGVCLSGRVQTKLLNVTFHENNGQEGGALYVPDNSPVNITSCSFLYNHGAVGGGAIYYENKDDSSNEFVAYWDIEVYLLVEKSLFVDNSAGDIVNGKRHPIVSSASGEGGAIMILGAGTNTTLKSSTIRNNVAGTGGGIMCKAVGSVVLEDVEVSGNTAVQGGGMCAEAVPLSIKALSLTRVQFLSNTGQIGGALSMVVNGLHFETLTNVQYGPDRVAELTDVKFKSNVAADQGGAVYFEQMRLNCQNCTFNFNRAGVRGATIEGMGKGGAISVGRNGFGMLDASRVDANTAEVGGGIYVKDSGLDLRAVNLTSNAARDVGGALAVDYGPLVTTNTSVLVSCESCIMAVNEARIGGAVHLAAEPPLDVLEKCKGLRDVLHLPHPVQEKVFELAPMCSSLSDFQELITKRHILFQNSKLSQNRARQAGAAIFTSHSNMLKICCEGDCKNGSASKYPCRNDKKMPWEHNRVTGRWSQSVVSTSVHKIELKPPRITDHASGFELPKITVVFRDELGQVVFGQNVSLVVGLAPSNTTLDEAQNTTVSGNPVTGIFLQKGKNKVTGITVRAEAGNYTLRFEFDLRLRGVKPIPIDLPVELRECRIGEMFEEHSLICVPCESESFGFNSSDRCLPCPANSVCNGSTLVPADGYWQAFSQSANVHECILQEACTFDRRNWTLGHNAYQAHQNRELLSWNSSSYWQCAEGYDGPLCGSCEHEYGRIGADKCGACLGRSTSILMLFIAFAIVFTQTAFLTRQALQPVPSHATSVDGSDTGSILPTPSASPWKQDSVTGTDVAVSNSGSNHCILKIDRSKTDRGLTSSEGLTEIEVRVSCTLSSFEEISTESVPALWLQPAEWKSRAAETVFLGEKRMQLLSKQKTFIKLEANRTVELLKILINFLQVIGTAAGINSNWTQSVIGVLAASDFATGVSSGSGLLSLECAFSSSATPSSILAYHYHLLYPFVLWLIFVAFWVIKRFKTKTSLRELIKRFIVGLLVILYVSYITVTKKAVKVYNCIDVDMSIDPTDDSPTRLWSADTDVECFEGYHAVLTVLIASPIMLLVVIGYPMGLILELRANRSRLNERDFAEKYGFLYKAYRDHAIFWEALVLMRKGLLATIVVFSSRLDPTSQGVLATLVLVIALLLHNLFRPYDCSLSRLNLLETWSLTISQLTFLCGVIFYHSKDAAPAVRILLSITVIGGVLSFVMFMIYELAVSGIEMLEEWVAKRVEDRKGNLFKDALVALKGLIKDIQAQVAREIKQKWKSVQTSASQCNSEGSGRICD